MVFRFVPKQPVMACLVLAAVAGVATAAQTRTAPKTPAVDYNRDVRPILSRNCFACHGPDPGKRAADLRLDLREAAIGKRGGRPGAIVPGAPEKGLLIQRIVAPADAGRMPPPESGHTLSPAQIATLKSWVKQGAPYAQHWAFVKPKQSPLPKLRNKSWVRNPIDAFVLARLDAAGLSPSPEADRYTLLRRVSLDLRGLPPTPQEVDAFAKDTSPHAYEKAVDRILADPAYGERWARVWLDLARYADSAGYGSDPLRTNIWPYRDWLIQAFNRNLPYDQFTTEQIAGDLLWEMRKQGNGGNAEGAGRAGISPFPDFQVSYPEVLMATAFHRNTMTNTEGGTDDEEFRTAAVKDRVDTTLQVWMGLTIGCAKCHTHKYDPISQKEYYSVYAFFNQTADADRGDESPLLPVTTPYMAEENARIDARIADLKRQMEAQPAPDAAAMDALQKKIAELEKARPTPVSLPVMQELPAAQQRPTHLMVKSNFRDKGEKVEPAVLAAFHPLPADAPRNRLGVAKWLTDPANPLTARVAVNRFWGQIFGTGLVETEEDFGTQGALPSHPELLDWLAVYFQTGKTGGTAASQPWDVKALLKLIVTSATYRQSSSINPQSAVRNPQSKDPRNRLLSRSPRYRLEAEMLRDQALSVSGLLSRKMYGPSVYPPQPPGIWQAAFNGQRNWPTSTGEDRYRRGLYTFLRRTAPYPAMATFDAPSREFCVVRRPRTNTPLQAFVTLNDPVFVEMSQAMARRIVREGGATPESRARCALTLALCRPADPAQVKHIVELFHSEREHYAKNADAAKALATDPLGPLPEGLDPAEAAAWTVVANVLLNLDGVLTRG